MNMNILLVIISLLFNLLSGGTASNVPSTPTTGQDSFTSLSPYLFQMLYMYGGNVDISKAFNQDFDQTYYLDNGFESYGWGKGSTVRVHGNMNSGIYFDFDIKTDQHQQQVTVDSPVDGLKIVTNQYYSGNSGYSFSVGPINLQTALQLFNYASSYMMPSTTTN